MRIKKYKILAFNFNDKEKYVVLIRTLKHALNFGLILEKVHRIIIINGKAWLKPFIDLNTTLRTERKNDFEKSNSLN